MDRYIRAYLEAQPDGSAQLQEMLAAGNTKGLALVAHSLRPQNSIMGAQACLDALDAIEQNARQDHLHSCAGPVAKFVQLQEAVTAELRTYLAQ